MLEHWVSGDDRPGFPHALSNQHAIERVAVMGGRRSSASKWSMAIGSLLILFSAILLSTYGPVGRGKLSFPDCTLIRISQTLVAGVTRHPRLTGQDAGRNVDQCDKLTASRLFSGRGR